MDKIQGNIDTLSSMQLTAAMEGLDAECKLLLSNREILAVILKDTVDEYKEYSREEITAGFHRVGQGGIAGADKLTGAGNCAGIYGSE